MRKLPIALTAFAVSLLAACSSGGEAGANGGALFVRSCSLGCSDGSSGSQISCQVTNTVQNTEISVLFTEPVDIATVSASSFRVVNVDNGTTPVGEYFLDPANSHRVVYRPALTFDLNGNPSFGFDPNSAYGITIPGELQGDSGPFIRSATGRANQSRLQCTILTTDQVTDPVPGEPIVEIYASYYERDGMGNLTGTLNEVANAFGFFDHFGTDGLDDNLVNGGAEVRDVSRTGTVYMLFKDVMNPATLANPITQTAPFVTIRTDPDGDLADASDRLPAVAGSYRVSVDTERLETLLSFTPATSFLSAGGGAPLNPRRMAVDIPTACLDLVGNSARPANGGGVSGFVTEEGMVTPIVIPNGGEGFVNNAGENGTESGALWGQNNRLATDLGGGSGRLGELVIGVGETLTLNTDSQNFPLGLVSNVIGNANMAGDFPTSISVTDGVFEFSSLTIQPGGILKLVGDNPARILVRGELDITAGALVDLSGAGGGVHDSTTEQPEVAFGPGFPVPPAGAGAGGWGGDRWDFDQVGINPNVFIAIGGVDISEAVAEINDGRDGGGLGGGVGSRGLGGPATPMNFPSEDTLDLAPLAGLGSHGAGAAFPFTNTFNSGFPNGCHVLAIGTAGSGGGYAMDGGDAVSIAPDPNSTLPLGAFNDGQANPGGVAPALVMPDEGNLNYAQRTLDWTQGFLLGGSGGGGGGLHPYDTRSNLGFNQSCPNPLDDSISYAVWRDHSGGRGGDGGGALHLAAGKRVRINGIIDLSGGAGQSSTGGSAVDPGRFAMPGGGGSGGALRVQAPVVQISPVAGRIAVDGGAGGAGSWSPTVFGGDGSMGLVRIETGVTVLAHEDAAPSISPFLGDGMAPFDNLDKSLDFLSVDSGGFTAQTQRPDSICASVSCWVELPGGFSTVQFSEDDVMGPGWDMDVIWQPAAMETNEPFRASSATFGATGFEGAFGNILGEAGLPGSPIVVRFQGARVGAALANPCNVALSGGSSEIIPGSLTTWVDHPAKLNGSGVNIIRYTIMFDNTDDAGNGDTPGLTLDSVKG
ncbi:MAG: Ig-like domain-containing protein, partial [Planctomycetota bacterium]|nr:Ig-like domain-containing protein [Planctomycetota bacterium]